MNLNLLEEAIHRFIKNHEGIRLRFIEQNGKVKQYISEYQKDKLEFMDFSESEEPESEYQKWVEQEARKPFRLENERLFYFALFKIARNDYGYLPKCHHLIADGWSINLMTEQICDLYVKLFNGTAIDDCNQPSYLDYLLNEKKYLASDRFFKNKSFWNEKFQVLPDLFLKKSSDNLAGKRKTFELEPELSTWTKAYITAAKCSLNTFFVAVYLLYLYQTTQQSDLVIGIPVLNRSGKEKSMFGMFTSTMPFRFLMEPDVKLGDFMMKVNRELLSCYFHQKYPYDLLMQDLKLKQKGYEHLFNVCINYYNTRLNLDLNGAPIKNVEFYNGRQIYSIQLVIKDWLDSGNLTIDFDFKVNDYTDEQIQDLYERMVYVSYQILKRPDMKVMEISLLSDAEKRQILYEFNASAAEYPKDTPIHRLFEAQVEKTPQKIAISFENDELTYRELNKKANQLARFLVQKGLGSQTIVGLLTTHSMDAVVGILGILKAGGAYLPIDPGYPGERINYMLEDSGVKIILTNFEWPNGHNSRANVQVVHFQNLNWGADEAPNLDITNHPSDLAYLIYTSGSTGKPKAALIEHQGLVNYIWWAQKKYVHDENEVFPLYSSLAFDLTVTSIFTPLISGGKIMVFHDRNDGAEYVLYQIMKGRQATVIKLTPSHLSLLTDLDNRNSSVKRFIVGGEDLKVSVAKMIHESFGGNIEIFNEYGPTEAVVGCMIHKYEYETDIGVSVPIGIPAANAQIYILDKNLTPVPIDTIGEMYISGDGVARGYLNKPELTQAKFIANPFIPGKRMYKTGDLARFMSDGKIGYVGRTDEQVKIHGYRVELGEIEKYLLSHQAVKTAVVIDYEAKNKSKCLCAYWVGKAPVSTSELKGHLLRYLPDYMVPLHFIELAEIPLTPNGKVNRAQLPEPELEGSENPEFISCRNDQEALLVNAVREVLNIETVGLRQNFYHLGGDSIKAILITSKLNDQGYRITVKDILSHPIIEEMALYLIPIPGSVINQGPCRGSIKLTPIVSWFFSQNLANPNHYNQSVLLEFNPEIVTTQQLELIFHELIRQHDALRINYNRETGALFYNEAHLDRKYPIQEYDLADLSAAAQMESMTRLAVELKASFQIENSVLIKACRFNLGKNRTQLLITAHHLVIDGVSWRIILDDICTMMKQMNSGEEIRLPAKTDSYQKWADIFESYFQSGIEAEKSYWDFVLKKDFSFPKDQDLGPVTVDSSHTTSVQIKEDITQRLISQANIPYGTMARDLLLTALLQTIKQYTGSEEVVIELEEHGREDFGADVHLTRTVGWFTSLYPFYIRLQENDLSAQLKEVKEELRKIPNHGFVFGIRKYLTNSFKENDGKHKHQIRFNYLGDFTGDLHHDLFKLLQDPTGNDSSKANWLTCLLEINCYIVNRQLTILLTFSRNQFFDSSMENFIHCYTNNLKEIIDYCCRKETIEFTPSDFKMVDLSQEELETLITYG